MKQNELLALVKKTVSEIEPTAQIILYGSRARGDTHPDSDWDFLILVDGNVDMKRKKSIRHRLYEIEWEHDQVISSIIHRRQTWNSDLYQVMPFHENVEREGVAL